MADFAKEAADKWNELQKWGPPQISNAEMAAIYELERARIETARDVLCMTMQAQLKDAMIEKDVAELASWAQTYLTLVLKRAVAEERRFAADKPTEVNRERRST